MSTETPQGGRAGQLASSNLRPGWTTGACATAAATAAFSRLIGDDFPDPVEVELPQGRRPAFALDDENTGVDEQGPWAMAAVVKDAGDDPDVTHGAVVRATVWHSSTPGVSFRGGAGVGTVTLPGLPLPVGEPAINPMPRTMITDNLTRINGGVVPDVVVEISIDKGELMAHHTWNPRIGILGGLSVLGTTGVVVPYSCSAWISSIREGIDVAEATGQPHVAGCTGSTSERVVRELYGLPDVALLDMGDFAGAVLKYLRHHPRPRLTLCGGFAKLSKLANGHLDLHSHRTSVDLDHLAGLALEAGADDALAAAVTGCNTAAQALGLCRDAGVDLAALVASRARDEALRVLRGAPVEVDVVLIDRAGTIVARSEIA